MWHVIARWIQVLDYKSRVAPEVATWVKDHFSPVLNQDAIRNRFSHPAIESHSDEFGWIVGRATKHELATPVITVTYGNQVGDDFTETAIRVSLLSRRQDAKIEAQGWRFEQAEEYSDESAAHPYAHAQAINGWFASAEKCLIHPPHTDGTSCAGLIPDGGPNGAAVDAERKRWQKAAHVKHPAFPLPTDTLTGLALGAAVTLYGTNESSLIVAKDPRLRTAGEAVQSDIRRLGLGNV
jgi:hypothetical protein